MHKVGGPGQVGIAAQLRPVPAVNVLLQQGLAPGQGRVAAQGLPVPLLGMRLDEGAAPGQGGVFAQDVPVPLRRKLGDQIGVPLQGPAGAQGAPVPGDAGGGQQAGGERVVVLQAGLQQLRVVAKKLQRLLLVQAGQGVGHHVQALALEGA